MPVRAYLEDRKFNPETTRVVGLGWRGRPCLRLMAFRSTDDAIAKRISELALAGERDIDNL
jgi:hypothetical protein